MKELILRVIESDFGSSTEASIILDNNIVVSAEDTSTLETNYVWDGWNNSLDSLIGKSEEEVRSFAEHFFDDFEDDFRQPFVRVIDVGSHYETVLNILL